MRLCEEKASEEARLEFDGGCSLHGGLSLPGCGFGSAAGLVGPYRRFETSFQVRCCTNYYLKGGRIEGADAHQVLKRKVMQAFGDLGRRRDGVFIQKVGDESRYKKSQQLHPCYTQRKRHFKKDHQQQNLL